MTTRHRIITILFICLVAGIVWFSPGLQPKPAETNALSYSNGVHFQQGSVTINNTHLKVDVALDEASWRHGMMFRKSWGDAEGMLFVFTAEAQQNFWMKNTPLPLDIIFFDASGKIIHIHPHAEPFSLNNISSNGLAKYVLEIPAGKAELYGWQVGDVMDKGSY